MNNTEDWHQKQLIQWVKQFPWGQFLFHIPNETTGGQGWIVRNSQMGCRKGVPDLMLPIPMHGFHGLFIEMKKPGGRLEENQKRWLHALTQMGYLTACCKGWEEARDVLQGYMENADTKAEAAGLQNTAGCESYHKPACDVLQAAEDNDC